MTTSATDDDSGVPSAETVFAGLAPSQHLLARTESDAGRAASAAGKGVLAALPVMLAGSVALTGAVVPSASADADNRAAVGSPTSDTVIVRTAATASQPGLAPSPLSTAAVPSTYRVRSGDTVSGIADRFGLRTASVLAANGLDRKSLIFPGQTLRLTGAKVGTAQDRAAPKAGRYTIVAGDTVTAIAARYGLPASTVLAANNLRPTSIIYPGQTILIPAGIAPASSVSGAPSAAAVSTSSPPSSSRYVIRAGDTVTGIAARFGLSVRSVLDANGLSRSSTIYAGRTLTIPRSEESAAQAGVTPLTESMRANARIIVAVGQELGVPAQGIVIALAAAMQESSLRNIEYGDRDSVGIFQQRPSTGWGDADDLLDVSHASRLFYGGPWNPNRGTTRGLLDIRGWQSMSVGEAAQAVQVSAHPGAYSRWERSARAWYSQLR